MDFTTLFSSANIQQTTADIILFCFQKHFAWEAPWEASLYDKSSFDWMVNVSSLKKLISAAGFHLKFMDLTTRHFEPTEGDCSFFLFTCL